MEPDEINILALTVLRNLKQIDRTSEAGLARQISRDVRKTNRRDRIHFDLTFFHAIPRPRSNAGTHADPDTAGDFSATNSIPQPLAEHHEEILSSKIGLDQSQLLV
jgi:hypothetical protein